MPPQAPLYVLTPSRAPPWGPMPGDADTDAAIGIRQDIAAGLRREIAHAEAWALYAAFGGYLAAAEGAERSGLRLAVAAVRLAWRAGVAFGRIGGNVRADDE